MSGARGRPPARRVVSLVPSITETLLGWGVVPVGVTRFCDAPGIPTVGGTKNPDLDAIRALAPDVVLMDREENRRPDAEGLVAAGLEVHATHVTAIEDVGPTLAGLATAVGIDAPVPAVGIDSGPGQAVGIDAPVGPGQAGGSDAPTPPPRRRVRVVVPIWRRPWMAIGHGTYAASLLALAGFDNALDPAAGAYPELEPDALAGVGPDLVLAPSEPYPFSERHRADLETIGPVAFVDGRDLFWWGVRTGPALARLRLLAASVEVGQ